MRTVTIHDHAQSSTVLGFDLKDVLGAIGQPALNAVWTVMHAEDEAGEIWATGDGASLLDELARTGERITGERLLEIAKTIHQTIWGEFQGFENRATAQPWIRIVAFDSTWFEVHTNDVAVLERLRGTFRDVRER